MYLSPLYLTLGWKASYGLCKSRIYSITDINTAVPFLSLLIFFYIIFPYCGLKALSFFKSHISQRSRSYLYPQCFFLNQDPIKTLVFITIQIKPPFHLLLYHTSKA